ncbi:MAG: PEP-CTERM sorting domain-containing protein [Myxococcota bacterium]
MRVARIAARDPLGGMRAMGTHVSQILARMTMALSVLVLALTGVATANATTIAMWTFETSAPTTAGPFGAEVGSGSARGFHAGASTYSSPAGNGSPRSFSSNTWAVGDYYQFQVDLSGYQDVLISWDQTSSGTGPRDFSLQYSFDGTNFVSFADYSVLANAAPNPVWSSGGSRSPLYTLSYDLSAISVLDGVSTAYFRMTDRSTVSASGGVVASGGTGRVDNVLIEATVVPEPGTALLLGIGLASLGGFRGRARR